MIVKSFCLFISIISLLPCSGIAASGGFYKIGKSYTIKNRTYTPKHYAVYEEDGLASWYGRPFHGRKTANGEIFKLSSLTAAHKVLPMPSLVKVVNLENGRFLILRINDRGPFAHEERIIDVSEFGAKLLGFHKTGLARVRVIYLQKETERYMRSNKHYKKYYRTYKSTISSAKFKQNQVFKGFKPDHAVIKIKKEDRGYFRVKKKHGKHLFS